MKPENTNDQAQGNGLPDNPGNESLNPEDSSIGTSEQNTSTAPMSAEESEKLHQEFLASEPETRPVIEPAAQTTSSPTPTTSLDQAVPAATTEQIQPISAPTVAPGSMPANQPSFSSQAIAKSKSKAKKPLVIISAALTLVILGAAGYVFGLYLPNKPENIWSASLDRSGKALDRVVEKTADKSTLDSIKKSDVTASLDISSQDLRYSGQMDVKYDSANTNGKLVIKDEKNSPGKELAVEFLSKLESGKTYPDAFLKVNGITDLGFDALLPGVDKYENKWIAMDSKYLDQILGTQTEAKDQQITADDVAELAKKAAQPTTDYIFSSKEDKAVLKLSSVVGEEEIDGRKTIHYKASIDRNHAKEYCKALVEAVFSTNFYKKTLAEGTDQDKEKQSTIEACQKSVDEDFKDNETYDVWVDKKYKLIYKVRFYESDTKTYLDVGQTYKGGDDFGFFAIYNDPASQSEVKIEISSNMKSNQTTGSIAAVFGAGDSKIEGSLKMTAKPYDGEVKVDKPNDTIPIKDMLKGLGFDDSLLTDPNDVDSAPESSSSTLIQKSQDSERQTDINAIHSQLEAYYAQFGYYPGITDMNNSLFIKQKLIGLDSEALKDPVGKTTDIGINPVADKSYGYSPSGCKSDQTNCTAYTLSVVMSTGSKYTKESLQ